MDDHEVVLYVKQAIEIEVYSQKKTEYINLDAELHEVINYAFRGFGILELSFTIDIIQNPSAKSRSLRSIERLVMKDTPKIPKHLILRYEDGTEYIRALYEEDTYNHKRDSRPARQ